MPDYQVEFSGEMLDFPGTPEEAAERFVKDMKRADYLSSLSQTKLAKNTNAMFNSDELTKLRKFAETIARMTDESEISGA